MKNFWKTLGVTALVVGLCPYRVTLDKSTGDKKIRALLWKATYSSRSGGRGLSLDFGFFPPNEEEEAHLFADELVVHYHNGQPCGVDDDEPQCQEAHISQEGTSAHSQWQAPQEAEGSHGSDGESADAAPAQESDGSAPEQP